MGPNGQAQYWAPNLCAARDVLMEHYDHTYVAPGEQMPRRARTTDPIDPRRPRLPAHVGGQRLHHRRRDLSAEHNPDRKKPFDIRTRDARAVGSGPPRVGTLGGHGRRGHRGGAGRAARRRSGVS